MCYLAIEYLLQLIITLSPNNPYLHTRQVTSILFYRPDQSCGSPSPRRCLHVFIPIVSSNSFQSQKNVCLAEYLSLLKKHPRKVVSLTCFLRLSFHRCLFTRFNFSNTFYSNFFFFQGDQSICRIIAFIMKR